MTKKITFCFDFGSPTVYLASTQLPKIAERNSAELEYKPVLLGGIFKAAKKNKKLAIPLALAGGVYALTKGKKKSVSEEMMTTGPDGFTNKSKPEGPTAGYDPYGKRKRKPTPLARYRTRVTWR